MPSLDQCERYWSDMTWITLIGRLSKPLQHAVGGGSSEDHLQERRGSRAAARLSVCCLHRESHVLGAPSFDRQYFSKIWILAHFPHTFVILGPASSPTLDKTSVTRRARIPGLTEGCIISCDAQGGFNSWAADATWSAHIWGDILTALPRRTSLLQAHMRGFTERYASRARRPRQRDGVPGRRPPEPDRASST